VCWESGAKLGVGPVPKGKRVFLREITKIAEGLGTAKAIACIWIGADLERSIDPDPSLFTEEGTGTPRGADYGVGV